MSASQGIEKNAASIALLVAIIALVVALIPQFKTYMANCGSTCALEEVPPSAGGSGPGGPGGPGMGGPGGPGMGGPGGFGGPSEEYVAKYRERVVLLNDAAAKEPGNIDLILERDKALLMVMRLDAGGRRVAAGASEAYLAQLAAKAKGAPALDINQAELSFLQAKARARNAEAFDAACEAIKDYPKTPATPEQLQALLAAERGA
ncbi:MAG TPA: hypothetical protein PLE35_05775 [Lentisphaeria bacterium]|nr:hypothetical protein [Lentisphaeria bacterium]